ncbi:MAG: aldo/keto reductase [Candidatus Obscuribacterales bacterium]|nr:aldo/keto reductase [Candidatus Obscuribacterales bacterium]
MKFKNFGASGIAVPVMGQGTWNMPDCGEAREEARKAIITGIKKDLVHIDTAEMYGDGLSEELVADAIKGFPRDMLFLVSKVLPNNATYKGTIKACEKSMRRMKIDYLDCYLLHWRGSIPLSDTMGAMEELVKQGKIRCLGVSNFDVDDLVEAEKCLSNEKIACNQVLYHLGERGIERNLIPYCAKKEIAVVAYTPFGQKPLPKPASEGGRVLAAIAAKHGVSVRQLLLAFLVREELMFAIPKAAKSEHVVENAGAGDITLEKEDIRAIEEHYPPPVKDSPLAMI